MSSVSTQNRVQPDRAALAAMVGGDHVRPGTSDDAVAGVLPSVVVSPASEEEIASVLRFANAAGLAVFAVGGRTKLGWGNPPAKVDVLLSLSRMMHVLEHAAADLTATAQAGCTVAELQSVLSHHGQRLAIDPLWPEKATIGGMLSTNDSGSLRVRFGALRDLIIGITLILPDGTLAKSGGKVVKNVAGYDLPKLATGALGTLGVISQATFRLHPMPRNTWSVTWKFRDAVETQKFMLAVADSKLVPSGVQARIAAGEHRVDMRFEGTVEGIKAQLGVARDLAGSAGEDASGDIWTARQQLWNAGAAAVICKTSVLPKQFVELTRAIESAGATGWNLVHQGIGIGTLRMAASAGKLGQAIQALRSRLEPMGGSAVVLECPAEIKAGVEAWGPPGDALPLMRRIKERFDPRRTLNPGRFIGGI